MLAEITSQKGHDIKAIVVRQLTKLGNQSSQLFSEVCCKENYIEHQDELWRQRHFGARWTVFLSEISDEVTLIQADEVFSEIELPNRFKRIRKPEDCNFSFFCTQLLSLKDALFNTAIKIKQLRDQITGEPNLKLMDTCFYFEKRAQALVAIADAQKRWVAIPH